MVVYKMPLSKEPKEKTPPNRTLFPGQKLRKVLYNIIDQRGDAEPNSRE